MEYGVFGMDIQKNHFFSDIINKLNIEILDSGYVYGDTAWNGKNICSPFSRLYYIESGHGILKYGSTKIVMNPGHIYLVPTGLNFSYSCEDSFTKLFFHVNITRPDGYDIFADCGSCIASPISLYEIQRLKDLYNSNSLLGVLKIKQELLSRVTSMIPPAALSAVFAAVYSPMVQKTIDYIQLNLSIQLKSSAIADMLFISESTLCKHFKAEVGVTIGKYIDDLIFFNAEKLLLKSNWSINQISETLGFCDQFYFSRRFKQKYNQTPLQYRKKLSSVL